MGLFESLSDFFSRDVYAEEPATDAEDDAPEAEGEDAEAKPADDEAEGDEEEDDDDDEDDEEEEEEEEEPEDIMPKLQEGAYAGKCTDVESKLTRFPQNRMRPHRRLRAPQA